jgi:hypothetical protein
MSCSNILLGKSNDNNSISWSSNSTLVCHTRWPKYFHLCFHVSHAIGDFQTRERQKKLKFIQIQFLGLLSHHHLQREFQTFPFHEISWDNWMKIHVTRASRGTWEADKVLMRSTESFETESKRKLFIDLLAAFFGLKVNSSRVNDSLNQHALLINGKFSN